MIKPLSKAQKNVLIFIGIIVALISFSAFHAYSISDKRNQEHIPDPFYSIRFALHPNRHIDNVPELGFKPGWVVTFAPYGKSFGTAYFVSLFGSILASGTPDVVAKQLQKDQGDIENFQRAFAELYAAIQVGMSFSNVAANLKIEPTMMTNGDGTISAIYTFIPHALVRAEWGRISIFVGVALKDMGKQ